MVIALGVVLILLLINSMGMEEYEDDVVVVAKGSDIWAKRGDEAAFDIWVQHNGNRAHAVVDASLNSRISVGQTVRLRYKKGYLPRCHALSIALPQQP